MNGLSTDQDIKQLTIIAAGDLFDYKNIKGIIPSGYGAGRLIVWMKDFMKLLHQQIKKSRIKTYPIHHK